MNYYIDYELTTGKILGFIIDETKKQGEVVEVSKEMFEREMNTTNNNKIDIDGENITFSKVDFKTLQHYKNDKIKEIKNDCTANAPVSLEVDFIDGHIETITFNGGDASASAIAGAVTLAQNLGETSVSLWDINNVVHNNIAFSEAMVISAFIAKKWRDDMFKRQDLLTQINNATTIDELGSIKWI